jgi:hypothetical protein
MPSFISSSETRPRWALAFLIALLVAAAICVAQEYRWRQRGYRPNILDTAQLWSMQRARAYASAKTPLLLLGASRIEYGIDMKLLKQLLPRYQPVMLAQNGHYPLATLIDLGKDENFHGVVLCDVDARGLASYYRDAQQPYVDYFRRQWSPSWRVHRLLLTQWQRAMLIADSSFGIVREAMRLIGSPAWPPRSPVTLHADRSGDIDFGDADKAALTRNFVEGFKQDMLDHPPQGTDIWLAGLEPVATAVSAIQRRGGMVIFVQTPTSGELHDAENAAYPRSDYWDRLNAATGARTLASDDVPPWQAFRLLDGSHVDQRDKPAYTRAMVEALLARDWLMQ